jgi:hypothetical protein
LLLEAPIVREETPVNSQPGQVESTRSGSEPPATEKRPVAVLPTALTRENAPDVNVSIVTNLDDTIVYEYFVKDGKGKQTGERIIYKGLQALDKMPGEEYGRRLRTDAEFGKKVEALEATRGRQRG